MNPLRKAVDRWFGRGEASITIPPMDGAFRPNDLLDLAPPVLEAPAPDCLAVTSLGLVVSLGPLAAQHRQARRLRARDLREADQRCDRLAGWRGGGGPDRRRDRLRRRPARRNDDRAEPRSRLHHGARAGCGRSLLVANGSATNGPAAWKRDLMEKNASGSVWRVDPAKGAYTRLAGDLAYPYGLLEDAGSVVVSESWRSALTRISPGGGGRNESGAGEPSRLSEPPVARRRQQHLARVVCAAQSARRIRAERRPLSSAHDRARSTPTTGLRLALRSGATPLEPTQQGGVRQLGVLKPWSPSRSYGLDRASRSRLSSDRQSSQPCERAAARRHQLSDA